jgi:hypothetical protein
MPAANTETVLEIGADGGSFKISRLRAPDGAWRFWLTVNEMDYGLDLDDWPGGGTSDSSEVSSFAEALLLLDRYPWPKLTPLRLLPEFEAAVFEGLRRHPQCGGTDIERWKRRLAGSAARTDRGVDTRRFEQAARIASIVHAGQLRKQTAIPYVSHVVQVARLLEQDRQTEAVVLAGLLHDVLEDAEDTVATREALATTFSRRAEALRTGDLYEELAALIEEVLDAEVLELVRAVTETKKASGIERPWKLRKIEQLEHLAHAGAPVAALKAADALQNASAILLDLQTHGHKVFRRFNASVDDTLWYYGTLAALTHERLDGSGSRLGSKLEQVVEQLTHAAAEDIRDLFTGRRASAPAAATDTLMLLGPRGSLIWTLDQWRRKAKPAKGDAHWKAGRSAMELARAWAGGFAPMPPRELVDLLESHDATRGLRLATALAEHESRLDALGKGRQHDLVTCGTVGDRRVLVAIEGKADEPFGSRIADVLRIAARNNGRAGAEGRAPSRIPERVEHLSRLLWGQASDGRIDRLRYQLLYALVGTLLEAKALGASRAVFIVHEFVGSSTRPERVAVNDADLKAFVETLRKDGAPSSPTDQLSGPFFASGPDDALNRIELFVGKVRTVLRAEEPE